MVKIIKEDSYVSDDSYTSRMSIASLISQNCSAELTAIEGYQDLLACVGDSNPEMVDTINEIISDEKNHIERLNSLMKSYDDIPANKD